MKKFFPLFLTAGGLLTLGVVSSCKDYNEDLYNDIHEEMLQITDTQTLLENLKKQGYDLSDMLKRIKDLEDKQCQCNIDVTKSINDFFLSDAGKNAIDKIVADLGYSKNPSTPGTPDVSQQIADAINKALATDGSIQQAINTSIINKINEVINSDNEDFQAAITNIITKDFLKSILGDNSEELHNAITAIITKEFLTDILGDINPGTSGLDATTVQALIDASLEGYCKSSECATMLADTYATKQALQDAKDELNKAIAAIKLTVSTNSDNIDSLFKRVNATDSVIGAVKGDLSVVKEIAERNSEKIDSICGVIDALQATVQTQGTDITDLWAKIAELEAQAKSECVWNEIWNAIVDERIDNKVDEKLEDVRKDISNALKVATQYADQLIKDLDLSNALSEYATLAEVKSLIAAAESNMQDSINALKNDVEGINTQIDDIKADINKLSGRMDLFSQRLNAQITSIIIQGAENPLMFNTTIALPIGIQSNILCAYYGEKTSGAKTFPATANAGLVEASGAPFNAEDLEGVERYNLKGETNFNGIAGKLYFTVNPSNCDFSKTLNNQVLYLYDSQNNKCAIKLTSVKKSDKLLTFGVSRAAENGFYEAEAVIDEDGGKTGDDAKLNISLAELKPIGNEIIKFIKTRQGVKNVVGEAAKLAYNAVQIPAYALGIPYRYTDDSDKLVESWTYSNYGIAALAVKPLSYGFDATGFTSRIPKRVQRHIPHIATFRDKVVGKVLRLKDAISISFPEASISLGINAPTINIDIQIEDIALEDITTEINANVNASIETEAKQLYIPINVKYEYEVPTVDGNGNLVLNENNEIVMKTEVAYINETIPYKLDPIKGTATGTATDIVTIPMKDITEKINENVVRKINDELGKINTELGKVNTMVNDINGMEASLNKQLNDILNKTAENINGQINDIFDKIEDMANMGSGYIAKADRFIDRINLVLDKVYDVIDNPNYYLQPVLLMHSNGVGMVSSMPGAMSSRVRFTDEEASFALYPTSYTAEILNPAYKKFIKVTNVWGGSDNLCKEAKDFANNGLNWNKVINGTFRSVPFWSGSKYAGLTYEITYAALDYSGMQSIQRYYITVVK